MIKENTTRRTKRTTYTTPRSSLLVRQQPVIYDARPVRSFGWLAPVVLVAVALAVLLYVLRPIPASVPQPQELPTAVVLPLLPGVVEPQPLPQQPEPSALPQALPLQEQPPIPRLPDGKPGIFVPAAPQAPVQPEAPVVVAPPAVVEPAAPKATVAPAGTLPDTGYRAEPTQEAVHVRQGQGGHHVDATPAPGGPIKDADGNAVCVMCH